MDFRQEHTSAFNQVARARRFHTQEILFIFLCMLGGPNEGGCSLEHAAFEFSVCTARIEISAAKLPSFTRRFSFGLLSVNGVNYKPFRFGSKMLSYMESKRNRKNYVFSMFYFIQ